MQEEKKQKEEEDALAQMPSYAKLLKEILLKKRRLDQNETVMLTEECNAIIQNKMPQKLKDPGSFTIPCMIGNCEFNKALCDLGANINLMPYSLFKKLGLGEIKHTSVSLQLADKSTKHSIRMIEDVLVKVAKFIFPMDFIVLEMEEDREIPLILGRPFLVTNKGLIDLEQGKLTLRIGSEEVNFNVFQTSKGLNHDDSCLRIDVLDDCVDEYVDGLHEPLDEELLIIESGDMQELEHAQNTIIKPNGTD
ncbi:uncharacterized protein LOC127794785 [Diospyros lotus]|uniref:uncharacterized protein LOC127794785 n=1 Tax=Diospyros lotus TaxID=55363 RepID=UPI0022550959|nr:uncharacterized protein LOC127794785 [Diospyros lotus]